MSRRARHQSRTGRRLEPFAWLGAGAVTLGMGAALAGGPAVAYADDTTSSTTSTTAGSEATSETKPEATEPTKPAHVEHLPKPAVPKKPHRSAPPKAVAPKAKAAEAPANDGDKQSAPRARATKASTRPATEPAAAAPARPVPSAAAADVALAPVKPVAPKVVTGATRTFGAVVRALMSPWTASGTGNGTPVESPAVWVLAAVARRETVSTLAVSTLSAETTNAAPVFRTPTVGKPNTGTGAVTGKVAATDADNDVVTYAAGQSAGGSAVALDATTGTFTYTPTGEARHAAAAVGATAATTDTFVVTASDGNGGNTSQTVTVKVAPLNSAPVLATSQVAGSVTATDADGDALSYGATPTKGTIAFNSTGAFTYTPTAAAQHAAAAAGASSSVKADTFTVTVSDGYGGAVATKVTVTIAPADTAPVFGTTPTVSSPNASTGVVTGKVTATDVDNDKLAYSATAAKGTVSINTSTGAFTYTPSAAARHAAASDTATDDDRSDTVTVTVSDGHGGTASTAVEVTVALKDGAPKVSATVGKPNSTTGVVAGTITATDADKDVLAYSVTTTTAKGTLTFDASTGAYTYTPTVDARLAAAARGAPTADKSDTFSIAVDDGHGGITTKTVTLSVSPLGDKPVAGTPTVNAADAAGTVTGAVQFTEPYPQLPLTYTVSTATTKGTLSLDAASGQFTYTPTAAARLAAGVSIKPITDTFVVTATNSITSTSETVTVTVAPAVLAVTGSVDSGSAPLALTGAVSPDGQTVYVTDSGAGTVSAVTGAATTTIAVGGAPGAVVMNASGATVYVADSAGNVVSVIDTTSNTVTGTITVGSNPAALLVSSDGTRLYVANAGSNTVSVVDTATGLVTKTIKVGSAPSALAFKLDGSRLFVANAGSNTVSIINPSTRAVTKTIKVGGTPVGLAFSPDGSALYVSDAGSGSLSVISMADNSVITTKLGVTVDALVAGPGPTLYVSDGADAVSVVTVTSGVDTPVAGDVTVGLPDETTGVVTGSLTYTDPSGKALTYKVITAPDDGTVTVTSKGTFTYTPGIAARLAAGYTDTTDTFTVVATNGLAATPQTVTVPVSGEVNVSVALKMVYGTEPVVYVSINGGKRVPVLVDTGSEGLVITSKYVGTQQDLGTSTGSGASGYSGGLSYTFDTYTTTVDFGNGVVSGPTSVDIVSAASQSAFASFASRNGVVGILGIGPNSYGPGPSSVITALPGYLNYGVLIDEQHGLLEFGPNPLTAVTTVAGAPWTTLQVQVGNGARTTVTAAIDSGGVYGTIPSSLVGGASSVPAGTVIRVYTGDGLTLLYAYKTSYTNRPTVTSDDYMNTGYVPFALGPIYISATGPVGQTVFDF